MAVGRIEARLAKGSESARKREVGGKSGGCHLSKKFGGCLGFRYAVGTLILRGDKLGRFEWV